VGGRPLQLLQRVASRVLLQGATLPSLSSQPEQRHFRPMRGGGILAKSRAQQNSIRQHVSNHHTTSHTNTPSTGTTTSHLYYYAVRRAPWHTPTLRFASPLLQGKSQAFLHPQWKTPLWNRPSAPPLATLPFSPSGDRTSASSALDLHFPSLLSFFSGLPASSVVNPLPPQKNKNGTKLVPLPHSRILFFLKTPRPKNPLPDFPAAIQIPTRLFPHVRAR